MNELPVTVSARPAMSAGAVPLLAALLLAAAMPGRAEGDKSPPATERVRETAEHVGEKVGATATRVVDATKAGVEKAVTATGKALDKAGEAIERTADTAGQAVERTAKKTRATVAGKKPAAAVSSGAAHDDAHQGTTAR